jgi:hypothetical protein
MNSPFDKPTNEPITGGEYYEWKNRQNNAPSKEALYLVVGVLFVVFIVVVALAVLCPR